MSPLVTIEPIVESNINTKKLKASQCNAAVIDPHWRDWQRHEFGAVFHDMSIEEFQSLKRDIELNGQIHPIMMYQGKVLDGWHRFRACLELDIAPLSAPLPEEADPLHHSLAANAERRQSKPSQLTTSLVEVWIAQERADAGVEEGRSPSPLCLALATGTSKIKLTKAILAKFAGVSERLVQQARRVVMDGAPDIIAAVKLGELSLERAVALVKAPVEHQPQVLEEHRATAAQNQIQKIEKHRTRAAQKRELAAAAEFAYGKNKDDTFSDHDARMRMKYVVAQMGRIEKSITEVNDLAVVMADLESPFLTTDVLKQLIDACEKLRAIAQKLNKRIAPCEAAV